MAIDSYRSMDLNSETYTSEIGEGWKRALALSNMIGKTAGNRIQEIESDLLAKFDAATKDDNRFGHWLAKTLRDYKLGKGKKENIATKLADLAQELERTNDFDAARDHYELAGEWFGQIDQESKRVDMIVAVAEAWAKEAEIRMTSGNPSALAALEPYAKAIQIYHNLPGKERPARKINERIAELIQLHEEAEKLAIGEMKPIGIPSLDINEFI